MSAATCPTCGIEARQHPASRCLDAWVADRIGWEFREVVQDGEGFWESVSPSNGPEPFLWRLREDAMKSIPAYSTDIAAAWELVDWLTREGPNGRRHGVGIHMSYGGYGKPTSGHTDVRLHHHGVTGAEADTAPLAICRALLRAKTSCEMCAFYAKENK